MAKIMKLREGEIYGMEEKRSGGGGLVVRDRLTQTYRQANRIGKAFWVERFGERKPPQWKGGVGGSGRETAKEKRAEDVEARNWQRVGKRWDCERRLSECWGAESWGCQRGRDAEGEGKRKGGREREKAEMLREGEKEGREKA